MEHHLAWPTTEAPAIGAVVVRVACDADETRRLHCRLESEPPPSRYPIGDAALAFAQALELCPNQPDHVEFAVTIADEE